MNFSRFVRVIAETLMDSPRFRRLEETILHMPATLQDLDASLVTLKQTIADTASRTSAKLDDLAQKLAAALAANQPAPDVSAEIADIQSDIAALTAVAPADPAPVVTPDPASVDPTATVVS